MLFALGHGQKFVQLGMTLATAGSDGDGAGGATSSEVAPASAFASNAPDMIAEAAGAAAAGAAPAGPDRFGYMFTGGGLVHDPDAFEKLGAVGAAMNDAGPFPGPSSELPAVLTYFGQFIDHDITANTDRNPEALADFSIAAPPLVINPRATVMQQLGNLRRGTLRLDSVYGDGTDIDEKLRDGAHMRVGHADGGEPNDLPRFGQMLDEGLVTDLPPTTGMVSDFGPVDPRKLAFIADSRNDENLVVAQLHLSVLRFHNAVADTLAGDDDARFARAKRLVQWHYQWLVVERYLAALCDPAILAVTKVSGGARYAAFAKAHGGTSGDHAPLPIEFSVAAFRFGHSMIRGAYTFNAFFGPAGSLGRATLHELFQFTGKGGLGGASVLPSVWIINWANFIVPDDVARVARPIDPALADALGDLVNESKPHLRSLAQRNLRRSYILNLPTAQTVGAQLDDAGIEVKALTTAEITAGPGGAAIDDNGYETQTPLWFYVLAEAQARGGGKRLGPIGSAIVAETLVGLIATDPESYWNAAGSDQGRWHPADAGLPGGPVDSFESFFKFAGVL
ncbi:hypothetical protein FHS95_003740 [Sphingomonas naasensis]|uniref:Peroxidase n=1 Tax=Sphingomonas naasensis TaxID=1344951 RepID=A0A4S1WGR3_9SPHN|nr:heme peroxidase family protein [Sphingomonas naasensis]NIJ22029.1 hypothetical protein [Sphingomonas naasensis]TGX42294.1 peroxidase [Sphingomonas naasensis]